MAHRRITALLLAYVGDGRAFFGYAVLSGFPWFCRLNHAVRMPWLRPGEWYAGTLAVTIIRYIEN